MGVVYKADDTKLRRTVALKFLPQDDAELRQRFLHEAQAAAALHHPNICTVFEIDDHHGFLAMELIEGKSLREKIAERPLPLGEALDIAIQACAGLQAAQEKGVVHRDIKPANLMITAQGVVKVTDLGLAQVGDRTRITKTGSSLGTPAYMSPEQARGEPLDHRTDLWSLGVTLYEMVTGRLPFRGDTEPSVIYSILNEQPEPPTALRSGLPLEIDRLFRKALAKDRENRYQTGADLLVDLRAVRSGTMRAITPTPVSRKKSRLIAALGVSIAAAGLAAWTLVPRFGDPPLESLAVLPLRSLDQSPDDAPLELGMADTIIARTFTKEFKCQVVAQCAMLVHVAPPSVLFSSEEPSSNDAV